ncbi:T9SS type A sorting domain-containing protein [Sabulibacter ruber]|uniref:T9SS type A sorting domain-containing protein n=1 Tax=Sabulibacter ruber TaxID=2811901 RepID=UPI001A979797|nr:T9SS type A sorting domain-containing protein [Sabulibacter ruber]
MRLTLLLFLCIFLDQSGFKKDVYAKGSALPSFAETLKTQPITGSPFCVGSTFLVSFTTDAVLPADNVFSVQLSNGSGSFSSPRVLASAPGTGSGSIQVTLPSSVAAGTAYRIRVVASKAPAGLAVEDNGQNLMMGTPPTVAITANDGLCAGGTLTLTANNVSGATYTWRGPNNFTATGRSVSIPAVETSAAGTYTVTIQANGCTATGSKEITIKPAFADAGADILTCPGQSVQLQATGGVKYSWSPSASLTDATIANPIATPSATTTYTVTVTNENGCVRTDKVVVTVSPLPTLTISPSAPSICLGSSVQLQASGAASYSWSPAAGLDDPTSATPVASPSQTTIYTVTATSAAGCVSTKTVTVTVKNPPVANAGFDKAVCSGQAQVLGSAATSSGTYLWEPAIGLSSATVKTPTLTLVNNTNQPVTHVYKLTVTSNGCVSTDEVAVTVNPAVLANAGPDVAICTGGSTQLKASGGVTYRWSPATNLSDPNSANPVAFPTATTRYIVTVTNAEGCSRNDTVFVNVNPLPVVTVTPAAPAVCVGSSVQLQASGAATYRWSPATGLSDPTAPNPIASPVGTTTYTVIGYSEAGCASVAKTVTVKVNPIPVANAGPDKVVCSRQGTTLGAAAVAGYTYSWSPAIGLNNARAANPTLTYPGDNAEPITVEYTLTVTANGCSSTDVVRVTVNPAAYAGPDVAICQGSSTQLQASGGLTYNWSPAAGLSDPTIANPIANPTATTTYTVTITNPNGTCVKTDQVKVTVNPLPTVTARASVATICAGGSVTLSATGGTSYLWSPSIGLDNPASASPVATLTETTTFTVTATDAKGCSNTAQVTVNVNKATTPTIQADGPTSFCPGGKVALTSSPASSYLWSNGQTTQSIEVTQAGSYTVTITDQNGCTASSAPTVVSISALPVVTLEPFTNVCKDRGTFTLTGGAPTGGTYSGPGVSNNQFHTAEAGEGTHTITYTYTNEQGCTATASQTLTVGNCLGVEDDLQAASLRVFPSPAQDELTVTLTLTKKEEVSILLTDLKGHVIYKLAVSAPAGEFKRIIPVQTLPQGMYLLQYRTPNATASKKVVIAR